MECPICCELIIRSCICSCTHHFCYPCIVKWCKKNNTCPKCKEVINEIRFDPEFDFLNNQHLTNITCLFEENKKILNFSDHTGLVVGITLRNNIKGPGVYVKSIIKNQIADNCNFKIGDIILFINNIPCVNHSQTISIIDYMALSQKNAVCILL